MFLVTLGAKHTCLLVVKDDVGGLNSGQHTILVHVVYRPPEEDTILGNINLSRLILMTDIVILS